MYLQKLSITNFRKYGETDNGPGIVVNFKKGLNVLIGENESGKSTIVDAIRYVLQTQSYEFNRIEEIDFHESENGRKDSFKIECEFKGFTDQEAGNFLEWIGFDEKKEYVLKVWLKADRKGNRIIYEVRAGADNVGTMLDGKARDLLRTTYLKPLRDAEIEMSAGRRSRFAQLLRSRKEFKCATKEDEEKHRLSQIVKDADKKISDYFENDDASEQGGKEIVDTIKESLNCFVSEDKKVKPFVNLSGVELWAILQRLTLGIDSNQPSLGMMNLLYIAAELMLLKREDHNGLKLAIIEELEAHLHPHYQINTLKYFTENMKDSEQVIITTHSVILGASVPLDSLIICKESEVFPMGKDEHGESYTKIKHDDEYFLERFLDATKANLFFAKGVIIVEGDAENLLIPALAEAIGLPLNKYGVSIVNVGGTAWKRYVRVFERNDAKAMPVNVSVVNDGDVPCEEYLKDKPPTVYCRVVGSDVILETSKDRFKDMLSDKTECPIKDSDQQPLKTKHIDKYVKLLKKRKFENKYVSSNSNIRIFSNEWTLEYNLAQSTLNEELLNSMKDAKDLTGKGSNIPDDSSDPYMMMIPFLGNLPKAVVAQYLGKIIVGKKNELKDQLCETNKLFT
ncbi:MAG TPA: AAA family ATPase [Bacilli bacterium]|nr:AAA family ATPase [Bacilli bacterium]